MKRVLVLHGPNLNLLGTREPAVYGSVSLPEVDRALRQHGQRRGVVVDCRQSNLEGQLATWLQGAEREGYGGVVFNPGAFTHYSIAWLASMNPAPRCTPVKKGPLARHE